MLTVAGLVACSQSPPPPPALDVSDYELRRVFGGHPLIGGRSPFPEKTTGTGVHEDKVFVSVFLYDDLQIAEWTLMGNDVTKVVFIFTEDEPFIMRMQVDYLEDLLALITPEWSGDGMTWIAYTWDGLWSRDEIRPSFATHSGNVKVTAKINKYFPDSGYVEFTARVD